MYTRCIPEVAESISNLSNMLKYMALGILPGSRFFCTTLRQALITLEIKLPSTAENHIMALDALAENGKFTADADALTGRWNGPASILAKLGYYLTDPERPHHVAVLSAGMGMRYMCRVESSKEETLLLLAPRIKYTDPRLYPLLLLPMLNPDRFLKPFVPITPFVRSRRPITLPPASSSSARSPRTGISCSVHPSHFLLPPPCSQMTSFSTKCLEAHVKRMCSSGPWATPRLS
ncbi:hypothetical protein B0H16DRAFT_665180 [Mycena metata]|uniref:Uncharacterized protein n=1 Tax=Mycena metata TaxID=1033252 RepID=A0AAD7NEM0_9AGAR|nr:hypothetical protein B0H16DRAFT_665180 [Mycena metata]